MASVAEKVFGLIKETVEAQGVELWDVRFVKEGASHYLRVFIDKSEGVSINDCTDVSHAIDPIIDEADPIDISYYLEVSSPGLQRELCRPEHFEKMLGKVVNVKLFKALEGKKEFSGALKAYDGALTLETSDGEIEFPKGAFAKVTLADADIK